MMLLLKGIIIGLSIAAPVGPIGILCIRRTINQGRRYGFVSGLGAATADGIYGCVSAFGLTMITQFLLGQKLWIQLIGSVFLCYLGVQSIRSRSADETVSGLSSGLLKTYSTTFFLTITNPMTILSFLGIFAGIGLSNSSDYVSGSLLVLGVFLGSVLWWFLLSTVFGIFREKLNRTFMLWINRVSGAVLLGFGAVAIILMMEELS